MASGNSKEVLYTHSSLILIVLAWSLDLFIKSRTVDLSKFGFLDYLYNLFQAQKFSLQYLYSDY